MASRARWPAPTAFGAASPSGCSSAAPTTLSNAYPNPFNPSSQFTLAVANNQNVRAELYNVLGQRVATLFDGSVEANAAQIVQIDGSGLASGAYIVRVTGETFADALRVTLTK